MSKVHVLAPPRQRQRYQPRHQRRKGERSPLPQQPTPQPQRARAPRRSWFDVRVSPYLYVAPFFVLFGVFGFFPMLYTFWVSLHDWEVVGDRQFIGVDNYAALIVDDRFWNAVVNTGGMFVLATVPQLLVALGLAHVLNRGLRARTLFRMAIVVPSITSVAAVAIVFNQLYARDFGMVNWLLGMVGVENVDWQAHRWSSWLAIATIVDWRWTGYNAIIYLAAMQAIPRHLYEAAAIDGASQWRQFWSVTVPMLRPTIIFTVIVSTIGGLQLFTEPMLFGSGGDVTGGSLRQFQTVAMYMFENAFRRFDYGYGAAVAWMLFLLIGVGSLLNIWIIRRMGRG